MRRPAIRRIRRDFEHETGLRVLETDYSMNNPLLFTVKAPDERHQEYFNTWMKNTPGLRAVYRADMVYIIIDGM